MIDAKAAFGILADGSDETTKIADAFTAAQTDPVYFGPGVYGVADLPSFTAPPIVRTANMLKTSFKNLSATSRMFEFEKHVGANLKTSFMDFGGFTIDQNGCTGGAIKVGAMFSRLDNIWIKGQRGAGWAVNIEGPTLGRFGNLHISDCSNGVRCHGTYYPRFDHLSIERTSGIGMLIESCAAVSIDSLYLDNGSVAGPSAYELLKIVSSFTVNIGHLTSEIGPGAALTPNWYFKVLNSKNVNINGGRVNHYSNNGSHYLFHNENSSLRIQGIEWEESKPAIIFLGGNGNMAVRDIVTSGTTSGSRHGVANWDGTAQRVEIENWQDTGQAAPHTVNSTLSYVRP